MRNSGNFIWSAVQRTPRKDKRKKKDTRFYNIKGICIHIIGCFEFVETVYLLYVIGAEVLRRLNESQQKVGRMDSL